VNWRRSTQSHHFWDTSATVRCRVVVCPRSCVGSRAFIRAQGQIDNSASVILDQDFVAESARMMVGMGLTELTREQRTVTAFRDYHRPMGTAR
jgi:hypothetical protein